MNRVEFIKNFRQEGFVLGEAPSGWRDRGHTSLFQNSEGTPIFVCAYYNGNSFKKIDGTAWCVELWFQGETFLKYITHVKDDMEFTLWLYQWTYELDGWLPGAVMKENKAGIKSFMDYLIAKN
jgi:hypothetical protein